MDILTYQWFLVTFHFININIIVDYFILMFLNILISWILSICFSFICLIVLLINDLMLPSRGLSTLAKELKAATRVMQRSSNELSTPVSDNVKNVNKQKLIQNALNSWAGVAVSDRPNVKLGEYRSQLEASDMSSHTEELWYYETVWGSVRCRLNDAKITQTFFFIRYNL